MLIKNLAKKIIAKKAVGVPTACILGWIGQAQRRSRAIECCGYLPSVISTHIPRRFGAGQFKLGSAHGTDQIAWRLWTDGWSGFEKPMLDLFAAAVMQSQTVIDIGANSGLYAMLAVNVSRDVVVHAFEPLPAALEALCENVRLNESQTRIHIVPFAVADQIGEAQFFIPAGNNGVLEMSASLNRDFRSQHDRVITVPVTTIDHYVESRGIERIDLLKIDVESQEHRVLSGAKNVLSVHRPLIFLEVLADAEIDELERIRAQHGYEVYTLGADEIVRVTAVHHDPQCPNQLLAPVEGRSRVLAMAATTGARVRELTRTSGTPQLVPITDLINV